MEQSSLHVARNLPPPVRSAVEQLLGRPLNDDESVSVHTYPPEERPADSLEARKLEFLKKVQENLANDDPAEQDRLVDEFRDLILGR
jgi:hypothetical protein